MDSPSDHFGHPPSQICPYRLYSSPPGATPSAPSYPSSSPPSYPLISRLMHSSGPQNCGTHAHRPDVDSSFAESSSDREEEEGEGQEGGGGGASAGVPPLSHLFVGRKRQHGSEIGDWCQELMRMKRLRVESAMSGAGERGEREGEHGRGDRRAGAQGRRGSREGRQRARQELKVKLLETRGKLLELQEKVRRAYGERWGEAEQPRGVGGRGGSRGGGEGGGTDRDEGAEVFTEDEEGNGPDGGCSRKSLPHQTLDGRYHRNKNNLGNRVIEEREPDGGRVWLGCGLVRGEWEVGGGIEGQKFVQALKQELGSAVARVIDRVVHLYGQRRPPSVASPTPMEGAGQKAGGKPRPSAAAPSLEPQEVVPLVAKTPQSKKPPQNQSTQQTPQLPQMNHGLPHLPHSHLPALLSTRAKDPFLPSYAPGPPPLNLPLLHYTMQHLFARSLSNMPLPKDCLSPDAFLDFRPHTPSFPSLPLLGPLDPPLSSSERGRDGGMRGVPGGSLGGYADGGDSSLYLPPGSSQEGLSPCHLKKAKLMFFYTRYPSSNTLKTYFPDVKFNRCITSQLIKWFSNFREFFYIQMERFARQAVREGVMGGGEAALRLRRDSELYRILNLHYNKSNDYHVPDRFVEISDLALREFFTAIQAGRDTDPCWKKSIYKIICKLDSPVPDCFRLPGCPTDTQSTG
ncbi:prospero homeobox 3 [Anguilla rostrata]|uniref:prospero homeobox 3 n=1 Tax=Anguilla rostrata TaxID=7938 RepID=UPI0030D16D3C